jgi:uncharacterized membrane protein YkgB
MSTERRSPDPDSKSDQGVGQAAAHDSAIGEVCIVNISTAERRKRLAGGIVAFTISLIVLAFLVTIGADRLWRLPLLFLFWSAASGFFQWRDKT